jgi:hypothetical protein
VGSQLPSWLAPELPLDEVPPVELEPAPEELLAELEANVAVDPDVLEALAVDALLPWVLPVEPAVTLVPLVPGPAEVPDEVWPELPATEVELDPAVVALALVELALVEPEVDEEFAETGL